MNQTYSILCVASREDNFGVVSIGAGSSVQVIRNRIEPLPPELADAIPLAAWKGEDGYRVLTSSPERTAIWIVKPAAPAGAE